jgi:hypothetical protein
LNSHIRTPGEIWEQLEIQKRALASSAQAYDAGELWEAMRLATTVYNIVNSGKTKTRSILRQLGVEQKMQFLSTKPAVHPLNLLKDGAPLCLANLFLPAIDSSEEGRADYVPRFMEGLNPPESWLSFKDWWQESIYTNVRGLELSRMNHVFALRSKDGGSHYDAEIPDSPYLDFKEQRGELMELHSTKSDGSVVRKKIQNPHLATMRQISYELEMSLRKLEK